MQKTNAAPLRLLPCIGKGFPEYAEVLGPPASVTKDTTFAGENRVYVSPNLNKQGIARINLSSYDRIEKNPHAVTFIEVVFKPGTPITWQKALDLVGLPKAGVHAVEQKNQSGNYFFLEGMTIKGVLMAPIDHGPFDEWDKGFGITWYDNSPETLSPVLTLSYKQFSLYQPIALNPWAIQTIDGAEGKLETLPAGAVTITTTKVGSTPWSNAAFVSSDNLEDIDDGYLITFEAKADYARTIWVFAELNERPYTPLGLDEKNVQLTTDYKTFSFYTKPKPMKNKSIRFPIFFVGDKLGSVTIRNLRVGYRVQGN